MSKGKESRNLKVIYKSLIQQGLVCQQLADINFCFSINAQLVEKK